MPFHSPVRFYEQFQYLQVQPVPTYDIAPIYESIYDVHFNWILTPVQVPVRLTKYLYHTQIDLIFHNQM